MSTYKQSVFGEIPNTWELIEAGKYCEKVTDGTHDSPKQSTEGYPLITSRHIKGSKIDFDNAYLISKEDYDHINKRSYVSQWDVIISMIGEYCGFTYLEENSEINYAIKNVGLFKTGDELKSKWLYYFFQSKYTNHLLNTYRSGTSQPYLALGVLREFPILIPQNHDEQESIVSILDSLRKKIELLQAQNKTLETIAQTIFKEWFGKYQIGDELPEGWRVGKLGEIVTPIKGKNITKKQVIKGPYPVIAGGLKPSVFHNVCNTKSPVITVSASGANAGFVALHHHPVWSSDSTYIDVSFTDYFYFIYIFLKSNQSLIYDKQEGSAIPHVYPRHLENLNLIIPTRSEMGKYEELSVNIFHKLSNNESTIDTLSKTRDTLLPKLMSGQVRVNNIKNA